MDHDGGYRWRTLLVAPLATLLGIALVGAAALGWRVRQGQPAPVGLAVGGIPPADPYALRIPVAADFAPNGRGYALINECSRDPAREHPCTNWLAVTGDGGDSWVRRDLPPVEEVIAADMVTLGGDRVVVDAGGLRLGPEGRPGRHRWYSADAGRTWQDRSFEPVETIDEIPPDARLIVDSSLGMEVLRPDGTVARLRHGPGTRSTDRGVCMASDGSVWALGRDGLNGPGRLLVSHDLGRTWQTVRDGLEGPFRTGEVYTADGRSVYLIGKGLGDLKRVEHSADGGATWAEMPLPWGVADAEPAGTVALVGGALLVAAAERLYRTTDGVTFEEVTGGPDLLGIRGAGAKVLGMTGPLDPSRNLFSLSDDGVTWRPLDLA